MKKRSYNDHSMAKRIESVSPRLFYGITEAHEQMNRSEIVLPDGEGISSLSGFFRVFADNTRLMILCKLTEGERCVLDIANSLGLSHSAVSHQLKLLRERNLVRCRKEGKNVWYSIADEHVFAILRQGISHVGI